MSAKPDDMLASMRWPVALSFVVAWNAPVIGYLFLTDFQSSFARFDRFIALQVGAFAVTCLVVALSAWLQRLIFRPGIPAFYFRRRLLILAGAYSLVAAVLWLGSFWYSHS